MSSVCPEPEVSTSSAVRPAFPAGAPSAPRPRRIRLPARPSALRQVIARFRKARRLLNLRTVALARRFAAERGPRALARFVWDRYLTGRSYERWIAANEPRAADLDAQRAAAPDGPLISIVVPTYATDPAHLRAMFESVFRQTYPRWELCVADGSPPGAAARDVLATFAAADPRVRVTLLRGNRGIAGNSNAALALASGDFVALLDHDDTLAPFALFEVARALSRHLDADVLYSDEDKIDARGTCRRDHHFKPDWSPDTLRSQNYITHLAVLRRSLVEELGGFRDGFEGSQDYDLILRATERARRVVHIPKVLYHWRAHAGSAAGSRQAKHYAYEAGRKALRDHLQRTGLAGQVVHGPVLGSYHINYRLPRRPLVSVVATRPRGPGAVTALMRALADSDYRGTELVVVAPPRTRTGQPAPDGSRLTWVDPRDADGRAALLNAGAAAASGEILVFLDGCAKPANPDWLDRLLEQALRPGVGAVGGKVVARDGSVIEAGLLPGLGGVLGRPHRNFGPDATGYACRLIVAHNVSAVGAGCLAVRRELFQSAGGFDAAFRVACHDADLCLGLRRQGHLIVWTPRAVVMRHAPGWLERLRRTRPAAADAARFGRIWRDALAAGDPYYNPNLSPHWEDFSLAA